MAELVCGTELLDRYADRAGLLEGALIHIAETTSDLGAAQYARDVLARAGCEPAQAGR